METIAWIGCSTALFAGILITAKVNRSTSDKLLSAWLFLMAFEFTTFGIDRHVFGEEYLLSNPFFLFNPALYLYILSLTDKKFSLRWIQLFHLLPYIFFESMAYFIKEIRAIPFFTAGDANLWFRLLFATGAFISWVCYSLLSIIKVHRHRINLLDEFSTIDSYKMITWILFLLVFYIFFWSSTVAMGFANYFTGREGLIPVFTYSALLLLTYILGFYGLKQQTIFEHTHLQMQNGSEKYLKSRLQPSYKAKIKKKINEFFEKEKPYLDPELTMGKLSEMLNISRHVLTEVINTDLNRNFYQLVNEYRVEAVKKKLEDPRQKHFSIEAIGYDCGFNSKSTFFSVFKSITGYTPAQYKSTKE
ncbi:MAG: helix-turn-helix domain-containing protein [Bacteroidales bacterium]|nr:helix-turn-helix domain-containing protein [Bacteroidales bacterium]